MKATNRWGAQWIWFVGGRSNEIKDGQHILDSDLYNDPYMGSFYYALEDTKLSPGACLVFSPTQAKEYDRRKLEKIQIIRRDVVSDYLRSPYVSLQQKARVWKGLELLTRRMAWDKCEPFLVELCARQDPPWDPAKAFPEPPGMEAYRANPILERRREQQDVEEGTRDRSDYE